MIFQRAKFSKALNHCQPGRERVIRKAMVIAGIVAGVYVLLMAGVTLNQRHMIYFPTKATLAALEQMAAQNNFQLWTNAAGLPIGWRRLSTNDPVLGQILVVHGNAGQALFWADWADSLQSVGALDVYLLEYPGFGARPGKPSQKTIFAAATEALSLMNTNRKTFVVAESLGTGVATYLASTAPARVNGVLLLGPYNNMAAVGQRHIRIFPVRWMLWDKYPSDKYLEHYAGPVGFLVGGRDTVIPKKFGLKLYDGYKGPKRLWEDPAAGHDQLHFRSPEWWREALQFLQN